MLRPLIDARSGVVLGRRKPSSGYRRAGDDGVVTLRRLYFA